MTEPFVAEIRIFPFTFAPVGWALCNGQLLPISQNTALFSLLGTFYGGNGVSTFGLPDLRGCVPVHTGQGPGLSERLLGEQAGTETTTLLQTEMPVHAHGLRAATDPGDLQTPSPARVLARSQNANAYTATGPLTTSNGLSPTGGGQPHNNLAPYLVFNFCIALQGIYPPRN